MALLETFTRPDDDALAADFLKNGYVIRPAENREGLDQLRHEVVKIVCSHLGLKPPSDDGEFLDQIHKELPVAKLNDLRMAVFSQMSKQSWFRPTYFSFARQTLEALVGNELVMQTKVNFSVQMPEDESSLLNVHADTWSEESPYQVVLWIPLVNVFDTKSMYILSPTANRTVRSRLKAIAEKGGSDKLFEEYKKDFTWLNVPYGNVLVFSPNLLHGNVINSTPTTRWSMNCRFKQLFTPYGGPDKSLGGFYLPITTRVASRVGNNFKGPEGFSD